MSVAAVADKIAVTSVSNRLATSGGDFDGRQGGKLYRRTETFSSVHIAAAEKNTAAAQKLGDAPSDFRRSRRGLLYSG